MAWKTWMVAGAIALVGLTAGCAGNEEGGGGGDGTMLTSPAPTAETPVPGGPATP